MGYERTLKEIHRYTPEQKRTLRDALNRSLGETGKERSDGIGADDYEALRGGTNRTVDILREQRDHYKSDRNDIFVALTNAIALFDQREQDSLKEYSDQINSFQTQYGEGGATLPIFWVQQAYQTFEKAANEHHNQHTKEIQLQGGATMLQAVGYLTRMVSICTARDVSITVFRNLRTWMDTPSVVCEEILLELKHSKTSVHIDTVSRLDLNWIRENINDRIRSYDVLRDACIHGYGYEQSGHTMLSYGMSLNPKLSEETIRKYYKYFKRLRDCAYSGTIDIPIAPSI